VEADLVSSNWKLWHLSHWIFCCDPPSHYSPWEILWYNDITEQPHC